MDLCWQSNIFTFQYAIYACHSFSSKEQASFNFMAAGTICSDFGAPKIKSITVSVASPSIFREARELNAMILVFWMLSFNPAFSLSPSSRGSLVPLHFLLIRVVSSAYLRFLIFLPAILIPVCASANLAFRMTYSAYKLNKQGDDIQPWCTPFPIWKKSIVPCLVLTVASWPAHRFLRRQISWSGVLISWRIFHN